MLSEQEEEPMTELEASASGVLEKSELFIPKEKDTLLG